MRLGSGRPAALAAILALSTRLASADGASVRAEVDATRIGVEDQVRLTITVEGAAELAEDIAVPPLKNLRVVGGPSVSQQFSLVNGSVSQSRSYTYVLQATGPGTAEIGAGRVALSGGVKTTSPIRVEVVPGSVTPRRGRPRSPLDDPFGGGDPFEGLLGGRRPRVEPKLKATAVASRSKLHVGEPVLVGYFVYTQALVSSVQLAAAPQYPGFWAEDLEPPKANTRAERVTLGGDEYDRFPILRKLLFPTRAGSLTLPPATFRIDLARVSLFDAGPSVVERTAEPLTLTVEPLPAEPGFAGAVGDFQVSSSLDRDVLPLGEAATLRFTVRGSGNLRWVEGPVGVSVPGAKVYPPQAKSDLKVDSDGMRGSKTWEFVVVPETAGALAVPPLPFAYFEPSSGSLRRTQTASLTLQVQAAGAPTALPASGPAPGAALPRPSGLALRSDLDPPGRGLPSPGPAAIGTALGLMLLLHAALAARAVLDRRRLTATGRPTRDRDVRGALGELDRARRGGLSKEEAAAVIERTLHAVFGPVAENGGPPSDEREGAVRGILGRVQFLRYAPQLGDYSEAIREVAAAAADVVRRWA